LENFNNGDNSQIRKMGVEQLVWSPLARSYCSATDYRPVDAQKIGGERKLHLPPAWLNRPVGYALMQAPDSINGSQIGVVQIGAGKDREGDFILVQYYKIQKRIRQATQQ
jgi:hypothetical protein